MPHDDVDPEWSERVEDDFQRALRGELRPVPRVPGLSTELVEDIVERFGELYRSVPDSKARILWSRLEPAVLDRFRATGMALQDIRADSSDPEFVEAVAREELEEEIEELFAQFEARHQLEVELARGEDGIDPDRLREGLLSMIDDWEPELGGDRV